MILRITKTLTDNIFYVKIEPTDWATQDTDLMTRFGEPYIETGGEGTLIPKYSFPTQPRKIKSGFPYTQSIDADGDPDAKQKMNNWASEIETRFSSALSTLRGNLDDFSGITCSTI